MLRSAAEAATFSLVAAAFAAGSLLDVPALRRLGRPGTTAGG